MARPSPFFHARPTADENCLAILHLKRDSLLPVTLRTTADDGYAEGAVTNTRFGSFPHSTLMGLEWGSQVRASKVDTGTRGRKSKKAKHDIDQDEQDNNSSNNTDMANLEQSPSKKRKSQQEQQAQEPLTKKQRPNHLESQQQSPARPPIDAGSGFIHLLQPTPETWTASLDHRTQVVYTPDYSYILQRLRVRPGSHMIEAGAGSGSFTHAAARAIYNGYPDGKVESHHAKRQRTGKVYSFEYHEPRVQTLRQEIASHSLDGIVELTHRDVCNEGFLLHDNASYPSVDAVFLDLPAPWHALKHLSRSKPSPLNPNTAIHLCTFSPCIEQVMATCSTLRKAGWTEIAMHEVQNRRIDVRRERVGLKEEGLRGVNASAANVEEAVGRLREVETKLSDFHAQKANGIAMNREEVVQDKKHESKADRLERIRRLADERKLYKEGNLVTRTEPDVKTHTSYLVFAVLPRVWSEEDERMCESKYPIDEMMTKGLAPKTT